MKTLLRSIFVASPEDDEDLFHRNYTALANAKLGFTIPEDTAIWTFVGEFVRTHGHVPSVSTIHSHFDRLGEAEVVDRLNTVKGMQPLVRGDFLIRLENKADDRKRRIANQLLQDCATILTSGLDIGEGKETRHLRGPEDVIHYVNEMSDKIITPTMGSQISGGVRKSAKHVAERYERVRDDPRAGVGQMSGLQQIDVALRGAQRKELWLHAAFTGGLKSTFLLNWLYNQMVFYRNNSLMFSLEMPFEQVNNVLYAMHSFHHKFKAVRHKLGLQSTPEESVGLNYAGIKTGELTLVEEEFFLEHVIPDMEDISNGYGEIIVECANPQSPDLDILDLRRTAERVFNKNPFTMLAVDHVGLMNSRNYYRSTTEKLNEVCRDLKTTAMYFNRGMGMAVIGLFQMSRDGYNKAVKVKEKTGTALYELTALSYANEAERSADKVTSSFKDDDLAGRNRIRFQCLKSRDLEPFDPFLARIEWPCMRLLTCFDVQGVIKPGEGTDVEDDKIDEIFDV